MGIHNEGQDSPSRALQEAQHRLSLHVENSPLAVVEWDHEWHVTRWAGQAEQMFGWKPHEVLGKRWGDWRFTYEDDLDLVRKRVWRMTSGEEERNVIRNRIVRKDGRIIHCDWYNSMIRDAKGNFVSILSLVHDVTDRVAAEERLRQANAHLETRVQERTQALAASETRWRSLVETAEDMITLHTVDGTYTYLSPASLRILGYKPEELIGRNPYELFHPDDLSAIRTSHETINRQPISYLVTYRIRHREGHYIWVETASSRLDHHDDGSLKEIICVTRNITKRVEAEEHRRALQEQLHQSQKMQAIGQLASGIAHDVGNALTAILGALDLTREELPEDHAAHAHLNTLEAAATEAASITRGLLTYGGRAHTDCRPIELRPIAERSLSMLRHLLPAQIAIERDFRDDPPAWVHADETQVQQILMNLIINARDAFSDAGRIRVMIARADGPVPHPNATSLAGVQWVCLSVVDNGSGMTDEVLQRVFEPFFTTKMPGQGTGLGLSIVHGIVDAHGGSIDIESAPNEGTTVRIFLPEVEKAARATTEDATATSTSGHGRVLFAEDNPHVRSIIRVHLEHAGYDVTTAESHDQLPNTPQDAAGYDAFILDVDLPDGSGAQWLREMCEHGVNRPAVIITGQRELATEDLPGSRTVLLQKPFSVVDVESRLGQMLAEARSK